jgi:CubicO group peptidase (beta-lactamase class C family)
MRAKFISLNEGQLFESNKIEDYDKVMAPDGTMLNMKKIIFDMEKAKSMIIAQIPLLAPYINKFIPIYTFTMPTMATDGTRLFVNPKFADTINEKTKFYSMSMGKSISAYVLGHAICANIVESLDHRVSDWPVLQGTLYRNTTLIDLVNMRAGDQRVVDNRRGLIKTGRQPNNFSIKSLADNELQGLDPDSAYFNYNSVNPNIVLNYVIYRSQGRFDQLMKQVFHDKVRVADSVFFLKQARGEESQGLARTTFYATRMDYLRIAQAMLEDWQADTCEGRFLKEVYARRVAKQGDQMQSSNPSGSFWAFRGYGGFFHTDYYNFNKRRNIIAMDGYGGQMIVIDFDQSRIVATHAVHNNYDWKALIADVIDTGKFRKYFWD